MVSSQAKPFRYFLSGPHACKTRGQCRQSTWSVPSSSSSSFSASSSSSFSTLPSYFPSFSLTLESRYCLNVSLQRTSSERTTEGKYFTSQLSSNWNNNFS